MLPRAKHRTPPWAVVVMVSSLGAVSTWTFRFTSEDDARAYYREAARALPRVCVCPARVALRDPQGKYLAESEATPDAV